MQSRGLEAGTKQGSLFAVGISFIVITSVIIFLRIYVRIRLTKLHLAVEDCKSTATGNLCKLPANMIKSRSDAIWCTFHDLAFYCQHDL